MPLAKGYAVPKGHAVRGIPALPGRDHYSVHVVDDELDYRIAINVRSNAKNFGKDLWFFLNEDFHHPIVASLKEREHSPFFGTKKPANTLGVRGYELVNTLDMGGSDDDLRSDPVVGGLS